MTWEGAGQVLELLCLLGFYFLGEAFHLYCFWWGKQLQTPGHQGISPWVHSFHGSAGWATCSVRFGEDWVHVQGAGVVPPAHANWLVKGGLVWKCQCSALS